MTTVTAIKVNEGPSDDLNLNNESRDVDALLRVHTTGKTLEAAGRFLSDHRRSLRDCFYYAASELQALSEGPCKSLQPDIAAELSGSLFEMAEITCKGESRGQFLLGQDRFLRALDVMNSLIAKEIVNAQKKRPELVEKANLIETSRILLKSVYTLNEQKIDEKFQDESGDEIQVQQAFAGVGTAWLLAAPSFISWGTAGRLGAVWGDSCVCGTVIGEVFRCTLDSGWFCNTCEWTTFFPEQII